MDYGIGLRVFIVTDSAGKSQHTECRKIAGQLVGRGNCVRDQRSRLEHFTFESEEETSCL